MDKKVIQINRKGHPVNVIKLKIVDLDVDKCSSKFLRLKEWKLEDEVYIKCNQIGNIEYKGKNLMYSIFSIEDHEVINV